MVIKPPQLNGIKGSGGFGGRDGDDGRQVAVVARREGRVRKKEERKEFLKSQSCLFMGGDRFKKPLSVLLEAAD